MIVEISEIKPDQAADFYNLVHHIDAQSNLPIREADETMGPLEAVELWIKNLSNDPTQAVLVAVKDEVLVGYVIIKSPVYRRIAHTALLMLGVQASSQGQGIGTGLLTAAQNLVQDRGGSRLELTYIDGNTPAQKLYEKNGYTEEGRKRHAYKKGATYLDEVMLAKIL